MIGRQHSAVGRYAWAVLLAMTISVVADVPRQIHYQGKLRDAAGNATNGNISLRFRLYTDPVNAAPLVFDETHAAVPVANGLFNVLIGSTNAAGVPDSALEAPEVFLGVSINGGAELSPRTRIVTTPYTVKAKSAEQLVKPGTLAPAATVNAQGDIGIGTASPTAKLDVQGKLNFAGPLTVAGAAGAAGQVLTSQGPSAAPAWAPAANSSVSFADSLVYNANSPGSWTVLDLSSVVGANNAMVMLRIESAGFNLLFFRENGINQEVSPTSTEAGLLTKGVVNANTVTYTLMKTDNTGKMQWRAQNGPNTKIYVIAYFK